MAEVVFHIGVQVKCTDGSCGRLFKLVVHPRTERVTDLIVESGFLLKTDRVIPVSLIQSTGEDEIHLSIASEQLGNYPKYREEEFETVSPER